MDFLKLIDNFERTVEQTVAQAASAVVESASEFPKPQTDNTRTAQQLVSTTVAANQAKQAESTWEQFDWQEQQLQWQAALQQLEQQGNAQKGLSAVSLARQLQELYQGLLSLPDPVPALNKAAVLAAKSADLESSCRSLQQQVTRLQQDQAEVNKLLQDFQNEQAAHAALQAAHRALQEELAAAKSITASAGKLEAQVQDQQATISSQQAALVALRAELEASQTAVFELTAKEEQASSTASTAEQLALEEIDRLAAQLRESRKEKAALQRQLQQQQQLEAQGLQAADRQGPVAATEEQQLQPQQPQRQHSYGADLSAAQAALEVSEETARELQHQVSILKAKLAAADSRLDRLSAELERRPSASAAASMAQQLAAATTLLGQQLEGEGWGLQGAATAVEALRADPLEQLEPLLVERCRRLDQALQSARAEAAAATAAAQAAQDQVRQLQQQLWDTQQLVKQLEADVLAMSSSSSNGGSVRGQQQQLERGMEGGDQDLARLVSLSSPEHQLTAAAAAANGDSSSSSGTGGGATAAAAATALLAAVTGQRDRFRGKLQQLDSELEDSRLQLQEAQLQVETLTRDNVAMVEKIRFLERFKHQHISSHSNIGQGSVTVIRVDGDGRLIGDATGQPDWGSSRQSLRSSCGAGLLQGGDSQSRGGVEPAGAAGSYATYGGTAAGRRRGGAARKAAAGGVGGGACFGMLAADSAVEDGLVGPEAKYAREYEARLNPFAEFQLSESEARLKGMQLHDKALLAGSRLIAGSKIARAAVAVYAVLLHVFIMVLMYASATPHAVLQQTGPASAVSLVADGVVRLPAVAGNATADEVAAAGRAAVGGGAVAAAAAAGKGLRLLLGYGADRQQGAMTPWM